MSKANTPTLPAFAGSQSQPTGTTALTLPGVCRKVAIGRSTIYALMAAGRFPMPAKCGKRSIWKASEIDAWLEARFAERSEVQA